MEWNERTTAQVADASELQRVFMGRVYRWMFFGLGLTAVVAYGVSATPSLMEPLLASPGIRLGIWVVGLGLVMALAGIAARLSGPAAAALFFLYAALNGVSFSVLLYVYDPGSVSQAFFLTALTFGAMSLYGTMTGKDLSGWGSFLFMGLFGIVIAGLINMIIGSTMASFVISCCAVLIFTGLTAYDTQKLRAIAVHAESNGSAQSMSIVGALTLYLDFINLLLAILRLTGRRR